MSRPEFDHYDGATLEAAKVWLREQWDATGAACPCCDQFVKLYKRKLTSAMAYAMILIYQEACRRRWDFVHVPSLLVKATSSNARVAAAIRGDWAKLKHWGMLHEKPAKRDDGSARVGLYQVTPLGASFVLDRARVPSHIFIYNEKPVARPLTTTVSVIEALGKKFDYAELMEPSS